ncbi:hypothetical protein KR054_006227 [Drosophila jambulina]|nr:hypothetical protein KR054_006227 [Drosophila jambulina]
MRITLKKFCFCMPVSRGCLIISLILLFLEAIAPPLRDPGPERSAGRILAVGYRILNVIHTLGCLVLFLAYFLRYSGVVIVFLATLILHMLVLPIFLFLDIYIWHTNIIDVSIGFIGEFCSLYFLVVAYSFYWECKEEKVRRDRGLYRESVTFPSHLP